MITGDFEKLYGHAPDIRADAPGRVNLIGEHTDYNGGYVLPAAIPQRTIVELARRDDDVVRVWSVQFHGAEPVTYRLGREQRTGEWDDYVQGMTRVLGRAGRLAGFDLYIDSTVPPGSGLSSSAALEIALGRALRLAFELPLDDVALAKAGRQAENEFVGAPVGIMDQMACSLARPGSALFLDTRSLEFTHVPIPTGAALVVIDSGISHRHAGGEYVTRRAECAEAARLLGVRELRDITDVSRLAGLPPPLDRRARHVVEENQRVLAAVTALRGARLREAGELFNASHRSLRDLFDVSIPAIDRLVAIAAGMPGAYGARLTGGGFGGSIVVLCDALRAREIADAAVEEYGRTSGHQARALVPA